MIRHRLLRENLAEFEQDNDHRPHHENQTGQLLVVLQNHRNRLFGDKDAIQILARLDAICDLDIFRYRPNVIFVDGEDHHDGSE